MQITVFNIFNTTSCCFELILLINIITPKIAELINNCYSRGEYPDALKIARVVPVYKAGTKTDISNYRPISVLPVINTIIERSILSRLLNFLEAGKYL